MKKLIWIFLGTCLACNSGKKIDQEKIAEEMRNREVVHIMPVQITERVWTDGKRLAAFLDSTLLVRLQNQLANHALTASAPTCHLRSLPVDSLQKNYPMHIKRLAFGVAPTAGQLSGKEYEVWDAYQYQVEQHDSLTANVQRDGEEELIYTQPILLSHATCLKCHGTPGKELTQADFHTLKQHSPVMDSLVGYKAGQTLGLWSFRFTKAAVVRQIAGARK